MIGRWESRIVIPNGDYSFELTDGSGGPYTVTLSADATYYHSSAGNDSVSLPAKLKALMDAASGQTYTVSVAATASASGAYTIAVDSGTFSIAWTDTALRDLLGYTANISSQASATGSAQAQALWLPQTPAFPTYGILSAGRVVSAAAISLSEDGTYYGFHGSKHRRNEIAFAGIPIARAIKANESVANTSFESFYLDCIRGEKEWANPGRAIRWYADASDDATYIAYNVINAESPELQRMDPNYDGLWNVRLDVAEAV